MKKLSVHWTSKISVKCKRNAIIGELHRAKKIASNFDIEMKGIVNNYTAILIVVKRIWWYHNVLEEMKVFTIYLVFSPRNKSFVETFIIKLNYFTNEKYKFNVIWNTKKVQFTWTIISKIPEKFRKRRVLEAFFIKIICPTLNGQPENGILTRFRSGITWM